MGLYDNHMLGKIRGHFIEKKFKYQNLFEDMIEVGNTRKTLFKFDAAVRAPMYGFKGGHQLYRAISCN